MMNNGRSSPRIHLVIGTKAQLIKMYPIIMEMSRNNIPFRYIDTGQHLQITTSLRKDFNLPEPEYSFIKNGKNVSGILQAILWNFRVVLSSLLRPGQIFGKKPRGICLVHGDTVSTIQGLLMAKRAGLDVGHVEAGERTHTLFNPFPEEIIRIIVDRFSRVAFASSDQAVKNLKREKFKGKLVEICYNTVVDSVILAQSKNKLLSEDFPNKYVLVSIHRFETIKSKKRLEVLVSCLQDIGKNFKIIWGLHEPTKIALEKNNLLQQVKAIPDIKLRGLFDYFEFIKATQNAEFLVTDGGGPQEESWLLNVPCLLMRSETERSQHKNVFMSGFDLQKIQFFIDHYKTFIQPSKPQIVSPSAKIVKYLLEHYK
jgi:UDP-N-acetylglucosamine 2-epimerase (non-hydrolysing)